MKSPSVSKRHPRARWIAGVMLVLALGPLLIWWWLTPWRVISPIERFMPDHLSIAMRINQPQLMWQSHWQGPDKPDADNALRKILEANGKWPGMVKKYGELRAQTQLRLIQSAFFDAIGTEAWLIFGEWNSAGKPGEGQVGLVALVHGDTVRGGIGPLMNLVMEENRVVRSEYRGVDLFEYQDPKMGRSVTFCQLGGWMVASLRQRGQDVLKAIIDQVHGDTNDKAFAAHADIAWPDLLRQREKASIFAVGQPEYFWPHFRQFNLQRGRAISPESEDLIKFWEQRLDGVRRVDLYQQGRSMLDFQLELRGERPTLVARQLREEAERGNATTTAADASASPTLTVAFPPELLQLDCSLAFARMALPLAGLSWSELLQDSGAMRMIAPQLVITLEEELADQVGESAGRLGIAAWPSANPIAPAALLWRDFPPQAADAEAPAEFWAARAVDAKPFAQAAPRAGDYAEWVIPLAGHPTPADQESDLKPWRALSATIWAQPVTRPEAYLTLHFETLSRVLHALPTSLMKKKAQKRFEKTRGTVDALNVFLGGVVLRLDVNEECWALTCRTL